MRDAQKLSEAPVAPDVSTELESSTDEPVRPERAPPFAEFVGMIAGLMALAAFSIDAMLPAIPKMGEDFHVSNANSLQWIISAIFIGMGFGQLIFGTLSDWLGRRPVLLGGIIAYVIIAIIAGFVTNLETLLFLRLLQGFAAAAPQVVSRSIIRDLYSGPRMAKVVSMAYVVFLMVPILAPSLGALILSVAPWPFIFWTLAIFGLGIGVWVFAHLPETRDPALRHKPDLGHLRRVSFFIVTEPASLFYTLAITVLIGSLLSYVSLMPQIFDEVFKKPTLMAPIFAVCAATMGAGSILNARMVEKLGSRRISHIALTSFVCITLIHFGVTALGYETLISFVILQSLTMGCMSLSTSNFAAIAMDKMGQVAGTAASIQGVVSTIMGAVIGSFIGQHWSGGLWLLPLGAFCCGTVALSLVAFAEKGKLYQGLARPAA
jgi:MFS transporter, DHA1 family, multidrug resistance protein